MCARLAAQSLQLARLINLTTTWDLISAALLTAAVLGQWSLAAPTKKIGSSAGKASMTFILARGAKNAFENQKLFVGFYVCNLFFSFYSVQKIYFNWGLFYFIETGQNYAKMSYSTGKTPRYTLITLPVKNYRFWTDYEPKYRLQA